ncbi:MAG TPA: glutamate-1-semialdehyde 2,1-aminomutase [Gemmatimonadales bacterium]
MPAPTAPLTGLGFPQISDRTRSLQERAHSVIPGGAHTYAKGDDQYPIVAPPFIARGHGCHVWDVDGNQFIEYGMGLRAVALGHAFPAVVEAAERELANGTNFVRPSPLELSCAEEFLRCVPTMDMVKFAKNGSDATTAGVKLARAHTGRDLVAICGDHPFFSTDDWFIGTTAMAAGIPQAIRDLTVKFHFNDPASLERLFQAHPGQIACVVLEAETSMAPAAGYLQAVRRLCTEHGAVLMFDEMITGFRWDVGGAQQVHGVVPDLATFGKAIANGFSMGALAGRRDIMDRGGIRHPHDRVFLLSTTHGAETHTLAAAIATMRVYRSEPVIETLYRQGDRLRSGVNAAIHRHQVDGFVELMGRSCNLVFATRGPDRQPSQPFRALFMQELIRRGVLAPSFVVSYSHSDDDIDRTIEAADGALEIYARALADGVDPLLVGRPVKPVFRTRN